MRSSVDYRGRAHRLLVGRVDRNRETRRPAHHQCPTGHVHGKLSRPNGGKSAVALTKHPHSTSHHPERPATKSTPPPSASHSPLTPHRTATKRNVRPNPPHPPGKHPQPHPLPSRLRRVRPRRAREPRRAAGGRSARLCAGDTGARCRGAVGTMYVLPFATCVPGPLTLCGLHWAVR